jgi:hypothetical protein
MTARHLRFWLAVFLVTGMPLASSAQPISPAQPALSKEAIRQFLTSAKVIAHKNVPKGTTRPVRLTLTDGTLTHDAAFSTVDEHISVMRFQSGRIELDFVDSYKYTVAAYRVAELLGLDDMMPVTVERKWDGQTGSLTWWVDDVKFDEGQRLKLKMQAPDPSAWNQQMHRMRVFTQLVADSDRNVGNVLITNEWKLWMIDFTRAFRRTRQLLAPGDLTGCDRRLLARLRELTKAELVAATTPYVGESEIAALMARRDAIVAQFEKLVAEKGETQVLY